MTRQPLVHGSQVSREEYASVVDDIEKVLASSLPDDFKLRIIGHLVEDVRFEDVG